MGIIESGQLFSLGTQTRVSFNSEQLQQTVSQRCSKPKTPNENIYMSNTTEMFSENMFPTTKHTTVSYYKNDCAQKISICKSFKASSYQLRQNYV